MNTLSLTFKPEMRYLSAMILGVIISLSLFFLMQALIDSGEQDYRASNEGQIMEFIRIKDDENLSFKDRVKPKKPTYKKKY